MNNIDGIQSRHYIHEGEIGSHILITGEPLSVRLNLELKSILLVFFEAF